MTAAVSATLRQTSRAEPEVAYCRYRGNSARRRAVSRQVSRRVMLALSTPPIRRRPASAVRGLAGVESRALRAPSVPPSKVVPPLAKQRPAQQASADSIVTDPPEDFPSDDPAANAEEQLGLAAAYGELQNLLLHGSDLADFLSQVAILAASVLAGVSCGITLRRDREVATVATSDSFASHVDEIQYGRGQGPCLQALHSSLEVLVEDSGERRALV